MAFTVAEVIETAREVHPAFDPRRSPDQAMLSRLNRYIRQLQFKVAEKDSSQLATIVNIPFPLADFAAGYTLPAYIYVQGGTVNVDADIQGREALNIVPYRNRFTPNVYSACFIHGGVLYFCGDAADWQAVTSVDFSYVPEFTPLTAMTDTVPLPDGAFMACADFLAAYMARRQGIYEGVPMPIMDYHQIWKDTEEQFLVEIAQHSRPEAVYVREEW